MRRLLTLGVGLFAVTVITAAGGRSAAPTTLVSLRQPLLAFSQDGGRIAWAAAPCGSVTIRDLATGRDYGFHGDTCPSPAANEFGALVVGGNRAVWWTSDHGLSLNQHLKTGRVGGRVRGVDEAESMCDEPLIGSLAADGPVAVYSKVDLSWIDEEHICVAPLTASGGVFSVDFSSMPPIPAAAAVALSGTMLAVVPADPTPPTADVRPEPGGAVEIFDLRTHSLTSVQPTGTATAIALSPAVLAVLEKTASASRIAWFNPRTGSEGGAVTVPAAVPPRLSAAGARVVYRVGRQIWVLDTAQKKRTVAATATAQPIGLSIEGRRIAWGENVGGRGRIRALQLP